MNTKTMVETAKHTPKGYIAATGCEVPIQASPDNVRVFIETAKEHGWYWD